LRGFHASYSDYFFTRLDQHLAFLTDKELLQAKQAAEFGRALRDYPESLQCTAGVLVHKDLALWNILGTPDKITAFIDWDDAVSGDVMDDVSLLACFYDGPVIARVLEGYAELRPLPKDYRRRFWLHLLRNMIMKSVIRVGAGYFDRTDSFFLIGAGASGSSLRQTTLHRLDAALKGLRENSPPSIL
jgi:Ser/Thr protein kinase RdoA (MazF antagonist)